MIYQRMPVKVIRVGDSLALVIPAEIVRGLHIERGEFFDSGVIDENTIVLRRVRVMTWGVDGESVVTELANETKHE